LHARFAPINRRSKIHAFLCVRPETAGRSPPAVCRNEFLSLTDFRNPGIEASLKELPATSLV
jgi:hypothetical protein